MFEPVELLTICRGCRGAISTLASSCGQGLGLVFKALFIVLLLAQLAACGGRDGAAGAVGSEGLATLVRLSVEPAGGNCAAGGTRIQSGLDANANRALEDNEVSASQFICHGSSGRDGQVGAPGQDGGDGITSLVIAFLEPQGVHCANGGLKIASGPDINANQKLEDTEIVEASYVCDGAAGAVGATGPAGRSGLSALIRASVEPAGVNCAAGGTKIEAGLDSNGNGVLDEPVTSTGFVCNGGNGAAGGSGSNGRTSLIAQVSELAGGNCSSGGTRINSGIDVNDNGLLEASEVTAQSFICNPPATGGLAWQTIANANVQAEANNGYIANNPRQVVVTLPASPHVGDIVAVSGLGAGGWRLAQNAGQTIVTKALPGGNLSAGTLWVPRVAIGDWVGLASSWDGTKLTAIESNGQIYTSADLGVSWTARESPRNWVAVASSSDGTKRAAVDNGGMIYTSADSGVSWFPRDRPRDWVAIASSSDGVRLVAAERGGQLYTSADSGQSWNGGGSLQNWQGVASSADGQSLAAIVSGGQIFISRNGGAVWNPTESGRNWSSIAASADGSRLVAVVRGGLIYTSSDFGSSWVGRGSVADWVAVASSTNGLKLVAAADNGQIHVSADAGLTWTARASARVWRAVSTSADGSLLSALASADHVFTSMAMDRTTAGTVGWLVGSQFDSVQLQHLGGGVFLPIGYTSYSGDFQIN